MLIKFNDSSLDLSKDADGFVSLTDIWQIAGADKNRTPYKWLRLDETRGFIKATARFFKRAPESLLKITKGKQGSTRAVEQVALEYAQYLSPELAVLVNQAFFERLEEEQNPELAIKRGRERAVRAYKRKGKDDAWIESRVKSIETRNSFVRTLARHGVNGKGFRNCTNQVYTPLFGGSTEVIRAKKSLSAKSNVRDAMEPIELAAVNLAELLASESIERDRLYGNAESELACMRAGSAVAAAIMGSRKKTNQSTF